MLLIMRAAFRRLLLLTLMLVLPLEAWASATMLACAFSHGAPAQQTALSDMPPCHSEPQSDSAPADHQCTHCAACVLASAIPVPAVIALPAAPRAHVQLPPLSAAFSGFIPEEPERPPRTSHA